MTLADRIVVLREGRVEQVGTPLELYHAPANRFVAGFIGAPPMNFLPADRLGLPGPVPPGTAEVGVRPEDLGPAEGGPFAGRIDLVEELGEAHLLHLDTEAGPLVAKLPGPARHRRGETLALEAPTERLHFLDAEGRRLARSEPAPEGLRSAGAR
jgi:ABC-type sugar transport system ATPase subunit